MIQSRKIARVVYRWFIDNALRFLKELRSIFVVYIRARKPMTRLFRKEYSLKNIVYLDITYTCNLGCNNCNRMCGQAPSNAHLSLVQIRRFVDESVRNGRRWCRIYVGGGEPTLHRDILETIELLLSYKKNYAPNVKIELSTNGYGRRAANILSRIPGEIGILNSKKKSKTQWLHPVNLAPVDSWLYRHLDFSIGCDAIPASGITLTPFGYYPCPVAGAIDRVFGFDIGRKNLPAIDDKMSEILSRLCRFCGSLVYAFHTRKQRTSSSWRSAFAKYKEEKPSVSLY
jgi:hypothetical protein